MKLLLLLVWFPLAAQVIDSPGIARRVTRSTFANLGAPGSDAVRYCTNCIKGEDVCVAGGTGALAVRINGTWSCAGGTRALNFGDGLVVVTADGGNDEVSVDDSAVALLQDGSGPPSGACGSGFYVDINSLILYYCKAGVWTVMTGSGTQLHTHADNSNGGQLNAANVFNAGIVPVARLGSGTPSGSNFLRGDGVWASPGAGTATWEEGSPVGVTQGGTIHTFVNVDSGVAVSSGAGVYSKAGLDAQLSATDQGVSWVFHLKSSWVTSGPLTAKIYAGGGSGLDTIAFGVQVGCASLGSPGSPEYGPIFLAAANGSGAGNASFYTVTGILTTGCAAYDVMHVRVFRFTGTTPSIVYLKAATFKQ